MPEQIPATLRVSLDAPEAERVIVRFLKDYAQDAGRAGFVVGISGGIDSAVAAALAVGAVGASNVHGLALPDQETLAADRSDATAVAAWLGVSLAEQSIQGPVEALRTLQPGADRMAVGNLKARVRMILLHAEAARRSALVLGTGNKSEVLTGYFSKYGDGGVDVQPIGDLYKTQVRALAEHLGVPQRVIQKPPTAGLWAGQTDEAELGITYERLDRVLLGFELRFSPARIAELTGVPSADVERIEERRRATQHKRRMPMAPKIGLRTVGIDWRTPTLEP